MDDDAMVGVLTAAAGRIKRAWWSAIVHMRELNTVEAIARNPHLDLAGTRDAAVHFASGEHAAYVAAGQAAARALGAAVREPVRKKLIAFDIADPPAVRWAATNQLDKIREITEDQRSVIRAVLTDAARDGTNPLVSAKRIRDSIGLTAYQEGVVDSYRRLLEAGQLAEALDRELSSGLSDKTIAAAQRKQVALTPAQIDTAVERYRANALTMRAETIARTEGLRVAHQGAQETYRQAIERGDIQPEQLRRTWNHHPGKRGKDDREFHVSMHGQVRGWDEPFVSGRGRELMQPGDPSAPADEIINCMCVVTYRLDAVSRPSQTPVPVAPDVPVEAIPVAGPSPVEPEPSRLVTDRIVSTKKLGGGINETQLVTFEDGSAAVWKPVTGESDLGGFADVPAGTMHTREAATYSLASELGIDVVPETAVRVHDGVEGSVQRFEVGTPNYKFKGKPDRDSVEQLRMIDFITGNVDRHEGNLLWSPEGKAIAIDNGVGFPTERAGPQQPPSTTVPFAGRGLLNTTRSRISALDLNQLAAQLSADGIEPSAVRHALYRAQLLKESPDVLAVPETFDRAGNSHRFVDVTTGNQTNFFIEPALTAESRISSAGRAEIDAIMEQLQ